MTQACGTAGYAAPEVFGRSYDSKVDLWSTGVIAFMLLTGQCPIPWGAEPETVAAGGPWRVAAFQKLSSDAQTFVKSLLSVQVDKRPSASCALQHPWFSVHEEAKVPIDTNILQALRRLSVASRQERMRAVLTGASMESDERDNVRRHFFQVCDDDAGAITSESLASHLNVNSFETDTLFNTIGNAVGEVLYSDFLAATYLPSEVQEEPRVSGKDDIVDCHNPVQTAEMSVPSSEMMQVVEGPVLELSHQDPSRWSWGVCAVHCLESIFDVELTINAPACMGGADGAKPDEGMRSAWRALRARINAWSTQDLTGSDEFVDVECGLLTSPRPRKGSCRSSFLCGRRARNGDLFFEMKLF